MKKIVFFVSFFILCFVGQDAKATHAAGLEITYEIDSLNPGCYIVTVKFYRDCDGIGAPTTLPLNIQSLSCGQFLSSTATQVSFTEISPICPGYLTTCSGGTYPGIQEYVYQAQVCLPVECNDWIISTSECCRNNAITNLLNPGGDDIYVETLINNTQPFTDNNTSAVFTNPPVSYICDGQLYCYNNGAFDADGDSLAYNLITPMTGAATTVVYNAPFSNFNPFDGVTSFDPLTGNLCVTPTAGVQQVTVLAIEVLEYRNGVLIGSIIRDIQVQVLACPGNNVPQLTGYDQQPINSMNTDTSICPGEFFNVNINAYDLDTNNLEMSWNSGISNSNSSMTFINNNTDSAYANFQWTPSVSDTSNVPYCFTITVADDACPIFSTFTYSYCISVGGNNTLFGALPIVCENSSPLALSGGTPLGGVYSGTGVVNGIFNPNIAGVGTHTINYDYTSNIGCSGNAQQNIEVIEAPWAGTDGSATLCTADGPTDLFNLLGNSPQIGGVWRSPDGTVMNTSIINPSNAISGSYTYTVYNPPCIEDVSTVAISFNLFPYTPQITNVSCAGSTDGVINILVNAGTAPFQYSIDGGVNYQFSNVFDQLSAGTYDVIVTDGNGCGVTQEVIISPPSPQIEVIASGSDVVCSSTTSGDVWISSITGGLPSSSGFSYTWYSTSNNQIVGYGDTLSGIPYGGYFVVAEDSLGCSGNSSTTITESTGFSVNLVTTEPICTGGQEGSIFANVSGGGIPPYSYLWSTSNPADTFETLYNLIAGTYDVTITDKYGCDTTLSVNLDEPPQPLSIQMESVQPISCYSDSTGIARVEVIGGEAPYSYLWSSGHVLDTAWNLWADTHTVVVTDARGCSQTSSVIITENSEIISSLSSVDVSCYGYNDGSAQVNNTTGGVTPYEYSWSSGSSFNAIINLNFGQYIVTTTDDIGCSISDTVFINQPFSLQSAAKVTDISCYGINDGELEAMVSGGTSPYTYQWLDGSSVLSTDSVVTGLGSSSNYQLQVTDSHGCFSFAFASIDEPDSIEILVSTITPAYCDDVATGGAVVIATGGVLENGSDYTYSWNNPGPFQQTSSTLHSQEAGDYIVTVMDDNSCTNSDTITIPLQPTFRDSIFSTRTSCYNGSDGSSEVYLVGGFAPYTYEFTYNNGSTQIVTSSIPSLINSNVPYGTYSVLITDGNGCDISDTGFVDQPLPLEYHIEKLSDQSCFGDQSSCDGELSLGIEGGNNDYDYSWFDNQGNILGSFTIANNNIDTVLTTVLISGLCEGFHTITVTDDKNCSSTLHINSPEFNPVEILEGEDVSSVIDVQSVTGTLDCYGDSGISASILNPDPRFTYNWYADGVLVLSDTTHAYNLPGGQLTAVASYLGCTSTSLAVTVQQPDAITATVQENDIDCYGNNNGSVSLSMQGGIGSYTYDWSNGSSNNSISGLSEGTYDVTVTDANGCTYSNQFIITEPSDLQVSINANNNILAASVSGGTTSYSYEWKFNNQVVSTGSIVTAQQTGYYILTVTDANGCIETVQYLYQSVSVNDVAPLMFNIYPNPSDMEILLSVNHKGEYLYKIVTYKGDVVLEGEMYDEKKVDISHLASGLYFVQVSSNKINKVVKLMVK